MSDRQKELRFRVSNEELAQIQENAKSLGMQINPFVRHIGTEYIIIVEDRTCFYKHRDTIGSIDRFLSYLERSFTIANVYRPKEMSDVYTIRKEVFHLLRHLYDAILHHRTKAYRAAQKEAQKRIAQISAENASKPNKLATKRPHSIRIKVNPHELEKIQSLATLHSLPIGVYLRYISLHPHFLHVDYPQFAQYTRAAEIHMVRILEVADHLRQNGDYEWYEMLLVLRAIISIARNERRLIFEVAYKHPTLVSLREKYNDIITRFESAMSTYQWALQHGGLHDESPNDDLTDDDISSRITDVPIEPIQDTHSVYVDDIIRNAAERSKRH